MFALRVSCVRPLTPAGRALLARDVEACAQALAKAFPASSSGLQGLLRLVQAPGSAVQLVTEGQVPACVAWHHLFAELPKHVHSPHSKRDQTLAAYLAELEASPDLDAAAWPVVQSCLAGGGELPQFQSFFDIHRTWMARRAQQLNNA
jgi:hypothetical protein